jgi:shikimate 5-dehydrogenase
VIVNATPIGLKERFKDFPLPVDILHSGQLIMDLVYGTGPTTLVKVAREKGASAIDGKEMLVMQAGLAYRLWTGLDAPWDVMRASMERGER